MKKEWLIEIEGVVSYFDADKVSMIMERLNWYWHDYKKIPTPSEIRYELRHLIIDAANRMVNEGKDKYTIRTRGFRVEVNRYWDTDKLFITVSFEIAWSDNFA
jgi:hypothetical protein